MKNHNISKTLFISIFMIILNALNISYILIMSDIITNIYLYNIIRISFYLLYTILCGIIVFTIKNEGLDREDTALLQRAYTFLIIGTYVFLGFEFSKMFNKIYLSNIFFASGNVFFYWMHLFFIIRQLRGKNFNYNFLNFLKIKSKKKMNVLFFILLTGTIIFTLILILIYFIFINNQNFISIFSTIVMISSVIIYAIIILCSLITGWSTLNDVFFPNENALLITIGITSFGFCELCTAFGIFVNKPIPISISTAIYYNIAFLLIALSGYKFKEYSK